MADKPILFSGPMVRALLADRKFQTRRLLRNPEYFGCPTGDCPHEKQAECDAAMGALSAKEVGWAVGDRAYVRETWRVAKQYDGVKPRDLEPQSMTVMFDAGGSICNHWVPDRNANVWKPSEYPERGETIDWGGKTRVCIHMPRWASRLWLLVTDVRVQRLADITEDDAMAEGIVRRAFSSPDGDLIRAGWTHDLDGDVNIPLEESARAAYAALWDSLHMPGDRWSDNPWVYALTFKPQQGNIDVIGA